MIYHSALQEQRNFLFTVFCFGQCIRKDLGDLQGHGIKRQIIDRFKFYGFRLANRCNRIAHLCTLLVGDASIIRVGFQRICAIAMIVDLIPVCLRNIRVFDFAIIQLCNIVDGFL